MKKLKNTNSLSAQSTSNGTGNVAENKPDVTASKPPPPPPPPRPPLPKQMPQPEEQPLQFQEVPKSPPKWPLRPGVMVHLRSDTKNNLCAARAQSPLSPNTSHATNVSYASPIKNHDEVKNESMVAQPPPPPPPPLPARNNSNTKVTQIDIDASVHDELLTFTTSNIVERLLKRLRWRRSMTNTISSKADNADNKMVCGTTAGGNKNGGTGFSLLSRANRRGLGLFRGAGIFGSGKSIKSSTGLFENNDQHQVDIECTEGGKS